MTMFNPPHPGGIIAESLEDLALSSNAAARALGVAPSTLSRVMRGESAISPEMAVKLEAAGIGTARHWLAMQSGYDLWHAQQDTDVSAIKTLFKAPDMPAQPNPL
ncbi:HigA family addiction module antitoxin [Yersinia enterocolitica]|nr:HigA family addiction module antidote protein [Yersinia enterocolitica]